MKRFIKKFHAPAVIIMVLLVATAVFCGICRRTAGDTAGLGDGKYMVEVSMTGGSGRAYVKSPAELVVAGRKATVRLEWSSPYFDYMKVRGKIYYPVNTDGNSVFEIPVQNLGSMSVTADTTAMSTPHEIIYTMTFKLSESENRAEASSAAAFSDDPSWKEAGNDISSELTYDHSMKLDYAEQFTVDYYDQGFELISISDGSRFLINTADAAVPDDIDKNITVLNGTVKNVYLAASATMDMFSAIGAVNDISLSGIKEEEWYIRDARNAMKTGRIGYAGKYDRPDYEKILSAKCDLAVESTMILHAPDVKEKLESFGIPVLVDHSSYEEHPLGRTEWVKLYGVLTGRENEADTAFKKQEEYLSSLGNIDDTGKTVVFFYITSNGTVVVRKTNDYVPKMIELAGGNYLFSDLGESASASSSVNMQMEEFFARAKDADILIYNSTIEGKPASLEKLLDKSNYLKDFKAVKDGNVWCTTQNIYQDSMSSGEMISEFRRIFTSGETDNDDTSYLYKLQ